MNSAQLIDSAAHDRIDRLYVTYRRACTYVRELLARFNTQECPMSASRVDVASTLRGIQSTGAALI